MEVGGDVISSRNVKTTESYGALNCEGCSSSSFQDFPNSSFCDGSGGVNAICSRPEVVDDVISGGTCLCKFVDCSRQQFSRKSKPVINAMHIPR